ncbi:MAG: hypothetical protein Q8P41_28870 [Pseudomonadota bacterium]|nr:hypothetical protein [Pseudomonadota bacterium]
MLRWPGGEQRGIRVCRGGIVNAADSQPLRGALRAPRVQFDPSAVPGPTDRRAVARCILAEALRLVGESAPEGEFDEFTLLAPAALLDELGLHPTLRWPFDEELDLDQFEPRRILALRIQALACLGLARVRTVAPPPPETRFQPVSVAPMPCAPPPMPAAPPPAPSVDPLEGWSLDPDLLATQDGEDDRLDDQLQLALQHVQRERWDAAEQLLAELRNRRLDNPRVLALLALARVGDLARVTTERVTDARRWIHLAQALGSDAADTDRVLDRARARVEEAERELDVAAVVPSPLPRAPAAEDTVSSTYSVGRTS